MNYYLMNRKIKMSFASLRIKEGLVVLSQNETDPRHPAIKVAPWEINVRLSLEENAELWGKYPLETDSSAENYDMAAAASNKEAIPSEFYEDIGEGHAFINSNYLYVKVFEDRDENGNLIDFEDVSQLEKTETYEKLVNVASTIDEFGYINEDNYRAQQEQIILEHLEISCDGLIWKERLPPNWANEIYGCLTATGCIYDNEYFYSQEDIKECLLHLGLLNPVVMRESLSEDEVDQLDEVEKEIKEAETLWENVAAVMPNQAEQYREDHIRNLAELNALREDILFQRVNKKSILPDAMQMELDLEGFESKEKNRLVQQYMKKLRELEKYISDTYSFDHSEDDGDDPLSVFASSGRILSCGRERACQTRINKRGKKT